jgi:hypothetical protein
MTDDKKSISRKSLTLEEFINLDSTKKYVVHKMAENPGRTPLEKTPSSQSPSNTMELLPLLEGAIKYHLDELEPGDIFFDEDKPEIHYEIDNKGNVKFHAIHKEKQSFQSVDDFVDYTFDIEDSNLRGILSLAYIQKEPVFAQNDQDELTIYELSTSNPATVVIDEQEYKIAIERTQNTCTVKSYQEPIEVQPTINEDIQKTQDSQIEVIPPQATPVLPIQQVVEQSDKKSLPLFQKIRQSKMARAAALALGFTASGLIGYSLKQPQVIEKTKLVSPDIGTVSNVPKGIEKLKRAYTTLTKQAIESEYKNRTLTRTNKEQANELDALKKISKQKEAKITNQTISIISLEDDLNNSQIDSITYKTQLEQTTQELDLLLSLQKVTVDINTCDGQTIPLPIVDGYVIAQSNIPILYNGECVNLDNVLLASDAIDQTNQSYLRNLEEAKSSIKQKSNQIQTQIKISDSLRGSILENRGYINQLQAKLKELFHSHEFATSGNYRFNQIESLANERKYHQINLLLTKYIKIRCQNGENQCKNFDRLKVKVKSCEEGIYSIFNQMTFSPKEDQKPDSKHYNQVRDHFFKAVETRCPSNFPKWMANPNKVPKTLSY